MRSTIDLKDAVARLGREDVEVVDVYTPGDQVALLRVKTLPGYAFLMDVPKGSSGTANTVVYIRYPDGGSDVLNAVCGCCSTEVQGLSIPEYVKDHTHPWYKAMREIFRSAVEKACKENGIHTIFTRKGYSWNNHFGRTDGLTVEPKEAFVHVMSRDCSTESIKSAYAFLSPGTSVG